MYTHTHFVEKNFLSEIEVLINQAAEVLTKTRSKDHLAMKLYTHAFDYAKLMNQVDEKSAPEIMKCLRQIYQVCKEILK